MSSFFAFSPSSPFDRLRPVRQCEVVQRKPASFTLNEKVTEHQHCRGLATVDNSNTVVWSATPIRTDFSFRNSVQQLNPHRDAPSVGQKPDCTNISNRAVFDFLDGLIDDKQRNKKPLARREGMSKPVFNFDIQTSWLKHTVDDVFELGPDILNN